MYIAKQKQTHKYRKQTSGYQQGEGRGKGQDRGMGLMDLENIMLSKISQTEKGKYSRIKNSENRLMVTKGGG